MIGIAASADPDGRNSMPDDYARLICRWRGNLSKSKTFHTLRIKMNLAMFLVRETFQQLRECAFRAMAAVNGG